MIKVSYNGSILNQSGYIISCATFDNFKACVGTSSLPVTNYTDTLVDRFANFSLIQNGLWTKSIDVTKDAAGLSALYVPLDPDDLTFQVVDSFYGNLPTGAGPVPTDYEGAHINYVFAGKNLPASSTCILVDVYYNYEVIADPSAAPIMRSNPSYLSKKEYEEINSSISSKVSSLISKPKDNLSWTDVIKQLVIGGVSIIPKLLSS
jgi:hypothetical protein